MRTLISHTETVLATPEQLVGTTKYHIAKDTPLRYPIKCDVIKLDDGYQVYASWYPFNIHKDGRFWDDLVRQCMGIIYSMAVDHYYPRQCPLLRRHIAQAKQEAISNTSRLLCGLPPIPASPQEPRRRVSYKSMMYRKWIRAALLAGPVPVADLRSLAEQEGFAWASVLRYAEQMAITRRKIGDVWQWECTEWV
jgi:hypothetical protein